MNLKANSGTYNFVEVSGTILRVLRLDVSIHNVYIKKPVSNHFCSRREGGGVKSVVVVGDCE
jgi:hypothetical protein